MQAKLSQLQRRMLCAIHSDTVVYSRASEHIRVETETFGVRYEPRTWFAARSWPWATPTSASLSRALARLEERGLVTRANIYDPTDIPDLRPARTTHVRLTPEGTDAAHELSPKKQKR